MQINYINCDNLHEQYKMMYYAWGDEANHDKVLLCLHGLNRNGRDWDYVAQGLIKQGYYVIAPDIVGRGNSDYLTDAKGYDIPYYCADILRLIAVLGLKNIDVLGTSMGGLISMALSAMPIHPVRKMILNDVGAELEIDGLKYIASYSNNQPDFTTLLEAKTYLKSITTSFGNLPDYVWEHITNTSFQKNSDGKYELKRDVNLAKPFVTNAINSDENLKLWKYWEKITVPTLVIRGAESKILSQITIDKMKLINPQTSSIEIKNTGHAPFLYSEEHIQFINNFLVS